MICGRDKLDFVDCRAWRFFNFAYRTGWKHIENTMFEDNPPG